MLTTFCVLRWYLKNDEIEKGEIDDWSGQYYLTTESLAPPLWYFCHNKFISNFMNFTIAAEV